MSAQASERRLEVPVGVITEGRTGASLYATSKRCMDVLGGVAGLIIAAPVMILVAIAIKLKSPGPVFLWQDRIGKGARLFRFCKVGSIVGNADEQK